MIEMPQLPPAASSSTAVNCALGLARLREIIRSIFSAGVCLAISSTWLALEMFQALLAQFGIRTVLKLLHGAC